MKYKIGDKLKVKKDWEYICGTYDNLCDINKQPTHIEIEDVITTGDREYYSYNIFNHDGKIDYCLDCFEDEHLEPFESEEQPVTLKKENPTMEVVSPEIRKWTDDDTTTYTDETVTFRGTQYTREGWGKFYNDVIKVNKRFK